MAPVEKTALECVMEVDHERIKLEAEAERLAAVTDDDGKWNRQTDRQTEIQVKPWCFLFLWKRTNY